ncbi:MAG TPA: 50S ribosomal protein L23 [Gammaproteobacteria bacterium]|nr:50S ribosomal protein L23 [Gammaproteobacteria bacterium]
MTLNNAELPNLILKRIVTEKSVQIQGHNQYTFVVRKDATKQSVQAAIESVFGVKVKNVNVLNMKPQNKTFRNRSGKVKAFKKAYVTLEEGNSIQFSEVS